MGFRENINEKASRHNHQALIFALCVLSISPLAAYSPSQAQTSATIPSSQQPDNVPAQASDNDKRILHAVDRLTFGPRPGDLENIKASGLQAFINQQLNPASITEAKSVSEVDAATETTKESNEDLLRIFAAFQSEQRQINERRERERERDENKKDDKKPEQKIELKKDQIKVPPVQAPVVDALNPTPSMNNTAAPMNGAPISDFAPPPSPHPMADYYGRAQKQFLLSKLTREIDSPRQLEALMSDFWFNHFNIFAGKEYDGILIGSYEDAIRPHVLGKFKNLVRVTCFHPAMLWYLDNSQNNASGSVNENYARELMELHTLGVDGGYAQKDVIELARVLTGLTIATHMRTRGLAAVGGLRPIGNQGAYFNNKQHDMGTKVLLGHTINGSGPAEINEALDILTSHPSTAHHICYQLAQYFVGDNPPTSLVNKMSARFSTSDGDIRATLRELFASDEFWDTKYNNNKFKTPLRYAISVVRAVDGHVQKPDFIAGFLNQQGQRIYGCLTPDGYKNTKDVWLAPDALLHRIEFAITAGAGKLGGVKMKVPDYQTLETTIGPGSLSANTLDMIDKAPKNLKSAAVLGSPEFMRY